MTHAKNLNRRTYIRLYSQSGTIVQKSGLITKILSGKKSGRVYYAVQLDNGTEILVCPKNISFESCAVKE